MHNFVSVLASPLPMVECPTGPTLLEISQDTSFMMPSSGRGINAAPLVLLLAIAFLLHLAAGCACGLDI